MILNQNDETSKRNYVRDTKPYVYQKMLKFDGKLDRGESIAILQFQYNYACNFHCVHCCVERLKQQKDLRPITLSDVRDLSKQADELGLARFVLTGGEPLVFKDLDQLVEAIDPQKFYINSDTNGWYLDLAKGKHLKSIGVDRMQISIDSLHAYEHDDFRQKKGSHARAMKAVNVCREVGLDLFIQTTVTHQRLYSDELIEFIEYFNSRNIGVFVTFAKPVGMWERNYDAMITLEDLDYFRKLEKRYKVFSHLTQGYKHGGICAGGWNIVTISSGGLFYCPYFQVSMGDFRDEPLKDILDRCMRLIPFKKATCLLAEDKEFVKKYLTKVYDAKTLPLSYKDVFTKDDFIGGKM